MQDEQNTNHTTPSNFKENFLFAALGGLVAFIVGLSSFQGDQGTGRDFSRAPASVHEEEAPSTPFSESSLPLPYLQSILKNSDDCLKSHA